MKRVLISALLTGCLVMCYAQNSVLINFGSNTCYNTTAPFFSLINNPLGVAPSSLAGCSLVGRTTDFFSVFIAYNPKNNKVYVADVRSGTETKIWVLDMGLPFNIACPPVIPVMPDYSYSYVSNNFEFDNNGDLWSFSGYSNITGQCSMDKFDVNTGQVLNTRLLQFPAGNFPSSISSGDLTILPNGRMFATLGENPSRLYEINNYSSTTGNASATFLQPVPDNCYGIAYLNGQLELTGVNFGTGQCYYFDYAISTNIMGVKKPFQIGQAPIDNSSLTPSVGVTKQLVNAVKVNANTADLTYELYLKNIGNIVINNVNIMDDLGAVYGAANVSNVSTVFVAGANAGGLTLNTAYNGTSVTSLLNSGQNLPNQTSTSNNYFCRITVQCRVTNLNGTTTYLNSAIGRGAIGNSANASLIAVSDSSNNGTSAVVDPNNNGNATETGENIPTPFNFGTLPVRFVSVSASLTNKTTAIVKWMVATPVINAEKFEIQYSSNGSNWTTLGALAITNGNQAIYQFTHLQIPAGNLYYRIKQTDNDGSYLFSRIVLLQNKALNADFIIYPNPAKNYITISSPMNAGAKKIAELYDATGRKVMSKQLLNQYDEISTATLPNGTYLLNIHYNGETKSHKIMVMHE